MKTEDKGKMPKETREKIANTLHGHIQSASHREHESAAARKRWDNTTGNYQAKNDKQVNMDDLI